MRHRVLIPCAVAMLVFSMSLALFCQDAQMLINQGNQYVQKKMWDKAIDAFQKAVALQPQNPKAHNNLGFVYAEAGFYKEALQEYEIALKIKPDYQEALQNISAGVADWSQNLIDHGQYSTAEEILKMAISRNPKAGVFYYFLGIAYQAQDRFQDAMTQWKMAAQISPESSIAHYVKAVEKLMARDGAGAIAELKQSIRIKPDNAYAHNMLGMLLTQTGKIDEAKAEFEAAVKYKPNYVEPYLNLAFIYEKMGKLDDAIRCYKTATIKNPYSAKGLMAMGKIYFSSERYFDAESCYNRALRVQPLNATLHSSLGFTYAREKKIAEAIKAFETAATIQPGSIDNHFALGLMYASVKGDEYKTRAVEEFQKCIAIDPSHKYSQQASQKITELGGSARPSSPVTLAPSQKVQAVQCESPDGDLTLAISPEWEPLPLEGEGADKFLWIMKHNSTGLTLTVYKPQGVPVNNLDTIKNYAAGEAQKKGFTKVSEAPFKIGETNAYKVQLQDGAGNSRVLFIAVKNKKAYVFYADVKNPASLSEAEAILTAAQIH